jgi:ferredoxin-NADP reductase/fatty acid desaturase
MVNLAEKVPYSVRSSHIIHSDRLSNRMTTKTWIDYSTGIAWGTVSLFVALVIAYVGLLSAIYSDSISLLTGMLISTLILYLGFTVVHEAGHGNIAHDVSWMKPIERFMGWTSTLLFFIVPFGLFAKTHDYHHAFTNDPDRDPDHWVRGDTWIEASLRALTLPLNYLVLMLTRFRKDPVIASTHASSIGYFITTFSIAASLVIAGYGMELLMVGIIPIFLSSFILGMLFDWIPHTPTRQQGRYQNTRSYLFPGLKFLTLGQNYHHIHHLYPRVSWYHYQRVFNLIRPALVKNNAPIEVLFSRTHPGFGESVYAKEPSSIDGIHKLTLEVESIEKLTPDSVAISFAALNDKTINFKAGQYVTVTKLIANQAITRCYSICQAPSDGRLTIGVKRVTGGQLSNYLNDDLKVGDELTVAGPFGDFIYDPDSKDNKSSLVLIAAGSGITPLLSIAKAALKNSTHLSREQGVHLIYVNTDHNDVMFHYQLAQLEGEYPEKLQLTHLFSRPYGANNKTQKSTYLTEDRLLALLSSDSSVQADMKDCQYYICGPKGLKDTVTMTLNNLQISEDQVFIEEFSQTLPEPIGELHPVNIVLPNGVSYQLAIAENQTVLQAAQQSGIQIPHACGIGQCGCCMMKIELGQANLSIENPPGLLPKEQAEGLTLACLCQPKSALSLSSAS